MLVTKRTLQKQLIILGLFVFLLIVCFAIITRPIIIHNWRNSLRDVAILKATESDPQIHDSPSISDIYISMVTGGSYFASRAVAAYQYWMQHFAAQNNFIITSNDEKSYALPRANIVKITSPHGSRDSYWAAQYRFVEAMFFMYAIAEKRNDKLVKWFMVTDDDTFVIPYNLLKLTQELNNQGLDKNISIVGNALSDGSRLFSGAGVIFSRDALKMIVDHYANCAKGQYPKEYDLTLTTCVRKMLDDLGRENQPTFIAKDGMKSQMLHEIIMQPNDVSYHYIKDNHARQMIKSKFSSHFFKIPKNKTKI
jgi:hypothetical protein